MKRFLVSAMLALLVCANSSDAQAQNVVQDRLSRTVLDVTPPSERVSGNPGAMAARSFTCQTQPMAELRRRIVDIAVQEWGYFGFPIVDQTDFDDEVPLEQLLASVRTATIYPASFGRLRRGGRFPALPANMTSRVASTVMGYWAATPRGAAMIANQNRSWNGAEGLSAGWEDPWSAAFVSWVMCEAGLGESHLFHRAIAHWTYIDQAINARDDYAADAAFVAYDLGEASIAPGDLLCSGRRPVYRSIAQRRRQLGVGARTHCDIVVKVDEAEQRIFAIGGNVRRSVSLKILPALLDPSGKVRPADPPEDAEMRALFAHLKLRADPIEADALDNSPTLTALDCELKFEERHPAFHLLPVSLADGEC